MFNFGDYLSSKSGSLLVVETESVGPHFETGLEIALVAAEEGWNVKYIYLGNSLYPTGSGWSFYQRWLSGTTTAKGWPEFSIERVSRNRWVIKQVAKLARRRGWRFSASIPGGAPAPVDERTRLPEFSSIGNLENWQLEGKPVGKYLASSAISQSSNARFVPKDARDFINILASVYLRCRAITAAELSSGNYDAVCVFNGRFAESGGVVDAVDITDTDLLFHERGATDDRYFIRPWRPHEVRQIGADFRALWDLLSESEKAENAAKCALQLELAARDGGLGPRTFASNRAGSDATLREQYDVVFFPTSDDEFESVANLNLNGDFDNQLNAIVRLAEACDDLGLSFAVRVHPNTQNKHIADWTWWNEVLPTIIAHHRVIRSDEKVNSYDLIDGAKIVVVNGSSIGIEALWRQTPVLAVCDTVYEFAGADVIRIRGTDLRTVLKDCLLHVPDKFSVFPTVYGGLVWGDQYRHMRPGDRIPIDAKNPLLWDVEAMARRRWPRLFAILSRIQRLPRAVRTLTNRNRGLRSIAPGAPG